jgi:hypothetical protein
VSVASRAKTYGFPADCWTEPEAHKSLLTAIEEIVALPQIEVQGLMTMAPVVSDPEYARPFLPACANCAQLALYSLGTTASALHGREAILRWPLKRVPL